MSNKIFIRLILLLIIEVFVLILAFATINIFLLPHSNSIRAYDWFLFEGILCIIISVLLASGRGGINAYTLRSAATVAATDAIYNKDYEVSTVFRKDKWKPEGFPKAALVLLIAGIAMLVIYFLTL